ncbi:hypothetical protein IS481_07300 [Caldimonas thermodepolymerans]|uniref:WD40 repeat protein n=1 Tax=Caldimonas thermodepolymerans TaxID=215580 RepID=A0A2S5T2I3_9BURK|nr:hypothetical protein [Caldimonas thermodepolymerans]PPE69152.1 hypothetical protein C1702_12805 [Caldimonas thermodepolymerans]QPC32943.1 hypothetical protein IS481_07300 [Caldimonas thermodepolymerans]RDI03723.1 hypothetical protein DES46_101408 [Caldimonas thermodepolymerans]TCP09692.1 hypothetical protein EV676_101268 [Caldimonas thermodepolymerans]UZG45812.1 hypothetical protein ONZ46_07660 [Caldimonas thermodepolymerans]
MSARRHRPLGPWLATLLACTMAGTAQARPVADDCAALMAGQPRPAPVGMVPAPVPDLPRPPKGRPLLDPVHGSCVVRVTDHANEPPQGFARHDYSRRQAFNADGSRLLVIAQDGHWHLYDARTLEHLKVLPGLAGDAEPQWHPTDPERLYHLPNNGVGMRLYELNVETGHAREVADLASRLRARWPRAHAAWTRSEGSPSADGRYWAFMVDDDQWQGLGIVTYDLVEDRVLATYDFAAHGKSRPDHLSMSPSGRYVVVSWNDGPVAFTRELTQPRPLQRTGEHSDIALTADGDDAYVAVDYKAGDGAVFMVNLRTGQRTDLFPTYVNGTATALHISGKAYRRPGWVLVSTYADYGRGGPQWLHRRLFAVELKARPRIVHLAHHRSRYAKYWTEPQATVNRDFTRLLFNSNWGTDSETDVDTYMVVPPPGALPR